VIRSKEFDADGMVLNCLNGIVDLTNGELMPHDKSFHCTKMAHAMYNTPFQAGVWPKFVSDIMCSDKELIEFLQRALGYSVTASLKEQCMFILYGSGPMARANSSKPYAPPLAITAEQHPPPPSPPVNTEKHQETI